MIQRVEVDICQQRTDDRPLRSSLLRNPFAQAVHHSLFQKLLHQPQDSTVRDPFAHPAHQPIFRDRVEVALQVRIDDMHEAFVQQRFDPFEGMMTASSVPKAVAVLGEGDVEDRFQHMQQRRLHHPISNAWNAQRPLFRAAWLGYPYALDRAGLILSRPKFLLQPAHLFELAVLESPDGLVIDSGGSLVAQHRSACRSEVPQVVYLVDQRMPLSSAHSSEERVQHAIVPHDAVRPFRGGWGLSGGGSPKGHCRQSLVRSSGLHAFISLRPFAPPTLPGFDATMDALTPAHRPVLEFASAFSCLSRCPIRHRSLDGCVWCSPEPRFPRVVTVVMGRYPCLLCCTFHPFCLQTPLAVPMRCLDFATSGVPSRASQPMRSCRQTMRNWVSP